jgi:hypothetical protein
MKRLFSLLLALTLFAPVAMAQDAHLQAFAGRTAPLAQDADLFSRSYQSGATFGLGGGVGLTDQLSLALALTYQRFNLRSPADILRNTGGGDPGTAAFHISSPYNMFGLETNVQYTFRPSAPVQPYLLGGLVNKLEVVEGLEVVGENTSLSAGFRDGPEYSIAAQAGAGVQARLTNGLGVFAEALVNADARARHSYPVRAGLTVGL